MINFRTITISFTGAATFHYNPGEKKYDQNFVEFFHTIKFYQIALNLNPFDKPKRFFNHII